MRDVLLSSGELPHAQDRGPQLRSFPKDSCSREKCNLHLEDCRRGDRRCCLHATTLMHAMFNPAVRTLSDDFEHEPLHTELILHAQHI